MKNIFLVIGIVVLAALPQAKVQAATIESSYVLTESPEQWGRVDFVVMLTAEWSDPYDSSDVSLDLELRAPSGERISAPCFYERGASGASSVWRARFAPLEKGWYEGHFRLKDGTQEALSEAVSFEVTASGRRGFLRANGPWTLRFDNGDVFRGVGENVCWESRSNDDSRYFKELHENQRFNYEYMLGRLKANGGNFFRTWMSAWNLPLEWNQVVDTDRYEPSSERFNPGALARMDALVDLCEELGVYMMLTLDHAGCYIGGQWELNSYNVKNGGPAADAREFFESAEARHRYKDKLRYLVARWGYSPSIAAWEFFNEVDNVSYAFNPRIDDALVVDWHREMSAHLKTIDVYGHLRTTSVSHRDIEGLNDLTDLDIDQRHIYGSTIMIADTLRERVGKSGRPYVIGEYGYEWDWSKNFNEFGEEMDREFEQGLWRGLFSATPILPMSWWWEFFDERDTVEAIGPVSALNSEMLAAGGELAAWSVAWTGTRSQAMGLKAGSTFYVLLVNGGDQADAGTMAIEGQDLKGLEEYDLEGQSWKSFEHGEGELAVGKGAVRVFALRGKRS